MNVRHFRAFLLLSLLMTTVLAAQTPPPPPLTPVESKQVCMINEQYFKSDQIPVEIDGKIYYGCCDMCMERLATDAASRVATDPVSGKEVDKAKAVIGAAENGKIAYFESEKNLETYNKRAAKKQ
ncbi:MAG TPA: hypothetical protein VM557_14780 [Thermoanaerobaculia bacterium]|nr:hypothetical protein [Thermoanaerobaculia bacterium]